MADYLVTGAAGGMGAAVCRALLGAGHRVFGLDISEGDIVSDRMTWLKADVRKTEDIEKAYRAVSEMSGGLGGIIDLAGIYDLDSLIEMDEEDFIRDFDINLFGVFRVNRAFAPLLGRDGKIVIVSSELAPLDPLPFTGIYAVTKAALDKYAAALRMELQLLGIKVVTVRPGAVGTDMLPESMKKLSDFCGGTAHYTLGAGKFRQIAEKVEGRSIPAERIAALIVKILSAKNPKPVYSINRNPLLLMLDALPARFRLRIIRMILSQPG